MVTWGTSPEAVIPIDGAIPDPLTVDDSSRRAKTESMLRYMGLEGGAPIIGTPIDVVFIGSCTNGRIEDLRAAAQIIKGKRVAPGVRAIVVPGSGRVKEIGRDEGRSDQVPHAGCEWREAGCSLSLGR